MTDGWPTADIVMNNSQPYGALNLARVKAATDCLYEVVASGSLGPANWQVLTTVHSIVDQGVTQRVPVRVSILVGSGPTRFDKLRVRLNQGPALWTPPRPGKRKR